MSGTEPESESDGGMKFNVGDVVHDGDADEVGSCYVVDLPGVTAEERIAYGETTVAEDNPEYPADAGVVVVVYANEIHQHLLDWDRSTPLDLDELEESEARHYSFPAPRLVRDHIMPHSPKPESEIPDIDENETDVEDASGRSADDEMDETGGSEDRDSKAVRALKERLESGGMTVEIEDDGETLKVEKLGDTYRVRPGEVVDGEGALRGRLETVVENYS